jgi:hypothetical protein
MEMVVLDWTRMGQVYCLAGVVRHDEGLRVVRPLPTYARKATVRNVGWPRDFLRGHFRWEVFELVEPAGAEPPPPHLEDVWVHNLRPRHAVAPAALRREILRATMGPSNQPLFGAPLSYNRSTAFLSPGAGCRSLASITVPANGIEFTAVRREDADEADVRVYLYVPDLTGRSLPVKDHFLLALAESICPSAEGQAEELNRAVRRMGPEVAVRLGLSRAYSGAPGRAPNACWLMADGFFSLTDPQP